MTTEQHAVVAEAVAAKFANSIKNRVTARKGTPEDEKAVAKLVAKQLSR